jgi:hypothetical protein
MQGSMSYQYLHQRQPHLGNPPTSRWGTSQPHKGQRQPPSPVCWLQAISPSCHQPTGPEKGAGRGQ